MFRSRKETHKRHMLGKLEVYLSKSFWDIVFDKFTDQTDG